MADGWMLHTDNYLQLVQDTLQYLKQNPEPALSNSSDCDYFRKKFKESVGKKKTTPNPLKEDRLQTDSINNGAKTEKESTLSGQEIADPTVVKAIPLPISEKSPAAVVAGSQIMHSTQNTDRSKMESDLAKPPEIVSSPSIQNSPASRTNSLQLPIVNLGKWKALLGKIAPELHVISDVPNDAIAKKIATRWKTKNLSAPITLLSYQEIPEQKAFLEQITIALDVHFGPSKMIASETIEKEQQWDAFLSVDELKLVITCDYTLWQMPGLLKFYKETPSRRHIGEKDLFLLPDLSLYLKDPLLKRSLWKALCQTCEPLLPLSSSTKI
jgi:hypothetical protein